MAFVRLQKCGGGNKLDPNMISVVKTGFCFGDEILKQLGNRVEIWIDNPGKKIGFKSSKDSLVGWKITGNNLPNHRRFEFPHGRYKPFKQNGMFVIYLPNLKPINPLRIIGKI